MNAPHAVVIQKGYAAMLTASVSLLPCGVQGGKRSGLTLSDEKYHIGLLKLPSTRQDPTLPVRRIRRRFSSPAENEPRGNWPVPAPAYRPRWQNGDCQRR